MTTLSTRLKSAIESLQTAFEPDFTSESGAQQFLELLKKIADPQQSKLEEMFILRGLLYYAVYTIIMTSVLVLVIFWTLYKLGPAGGYYTDWIPLTGILIVSVPFAVMWFYMIFRFGKEGLLGRSLAVSKEQSIASLDPEVKPFENTLKQCILELKYLIDTLNDKVALINQALSYFVPVLLFLYVVMIIFSGADPTKDKTPIAIITYASTLLVGMFATLTVLPLRFAAHFRLTLYRKWVKRIEGLLITGAEDPIKESS